PRRRRLRPPRHRPARARPLRAPPWRPVRKRENRLVASYSLYSLYWLSQRQLQISSLGEPAAGRLVCIGGRRHLGRVIGPGRLDIRAGLLRFDLGRGRLRFDFGFGRLWLI